MPKGTILMWDGVNWTDNVTLTGWYKCAGQNTPYGKTPDLRDRFILGSGNGGMQGGNANNEVILTAKNMPSHTHSGAGLTTEPGGGHLHSFPLSGQDDDNHSNTNFPNGAAAADEDKILGQGTISWSGVHSHSCDTGILENTGESRPFNVMPRAYKTIYIKKMV